MKNLLSLQNKNYNKMKNKMKKALTETNDQRIPGSVIFHPYHFRLIDKSGIIERLKAKQLKYHN